MDLGIKNKVALVTAASQGLGKASALELAKEGVRLAICSRDEQKIENAAKEIIDQTGSEVIHFETNLDNDDDISNLIDSCLLYTSPSPRDRTRSRMPSSA